jgi:hypothetical protein
MPFHSCSLLKSAELWSACAAAWIAAYIPAFAHGFAGDRFFPATISTDDPFAASELSLPTFSEVRQPGQPPVKVFDISTDLSLLVLPRTALTIGDGYSIQKVPNQPHRPGSIMLHSTFSMSFLRTTNTKPLLPLV